jgi:hypothetical protein
MKWGKDAMSKRTRQYIGILAAVAAYYIIHEGAHLLVALYYGTFKQINLMGLGMQVDVFAECMTDAQLGIFCLMGAVATLLCGWLLIAFTKRICEAKSKVFKAIMWYISLAILLIDPLYLSVLCTFFGGGDMNGIGLLLPEIGVRAVFGVIGIVHAAVIWKYLLPEYTKSFQQ